jgi:prepilin-type N-terminal cleavage/methylation domain-containing protein
VILRSKDGFTLVELIVVLAIITLMSAMVIPRISVYFGGGKGDILVLRSVIAKTYDNAFLRSEKCFLVIHCSTPDVNLREYDPDKILSRENGVSVAVMNAEGILTDSKNRSLQFRRFPSGFKIDEVILSNGETIKGGSAMIPFDSDGISSDAIIHITIGNDPYSVVIYRLRKESISVEGHVDFDAVRNGEIL